MGGIVSWCGSQNAGAMTGQSWICSKLYATGEGWILVPGITHLVPGKQQNISSSLEDDGTQIILSPQKS